MQDLSERDQAWDFANTVLTTAYPNATLKGLVREAQSGQTVNVPPAHQYVFLADFGGGFTSEATVWRSPSGWVVSVASTPDSLLARTLP